MNKLSFDLKFSKWEVNNISSFCKTQIIFLAIILFSNLWTLLQITSELISKLGVEITLLIVRAEVTVLCWIYEGCIPNPQDCNSISSPEKKEDA